MRRLETGDVTYLAGGQSELIKLLVADADDLGAAFPFNELSEEEVIEVYQRSRWFWDARAGSPALQELRRLIRDGERPYIFIITGNVFELDFGDACLNLCYPFGVCDALIDRLENGNLRMRQITPRLAEVARRGREIYTDRAKMGLLKHSPESHCCVEELRRWLFREEGT